MVGLMMMIFCCCNDATKMNGDLDVRIGCGRNGQRKGFGEGQDLSGGIVLVTSDGNRELTEGFREGVQQFIAGNTDAAEMQTHLGEFSAGEDETPMAVSRDVGARRTDGKETVLVTPDGVAVGFVQCAGKRGTKGR